MIDQGITGYTGQRGEELDPGYERREYNGAEFKERATRLLEKHAEDIYDAQMTFPPLPEIGNEIKRVPLEILESTYGHGVLRGTSEQRLAALFGILETGAITGDYAALAGSGHIDAYSHGVDYLIILDKNEVESHRNLNSQERKKSRVVLNDGAGQEKYALSLEVCAVVCNSHVNCLVEDLRVMYPDMTILRSNEVASYLENGNNE